MAAAAGIGWYGPLIDLSKASSHIGGYVQLLVFVHTTTQTPPPPIQIQRSKKGGAVLLRRRTDIQVGDDTRSHFSVSIWQNNMASKIHSGDIILLQNVKIVRFGGLVEAGTVQVSSLITLVHPLQLLISKGVEELALGCRVAETTKEKLKKVIKWVQRTRASQNCVQAHTPHRDQLTTNWKVHEERVAHDCSSISELLRRNQCCQEDFSAFVGEIFLPFTSGPEKEIEEGMMFIRRRLFIKGDKKLVEDLICLGCKLCGYPMDSDDGSLLEQKRFPLYCQKSSNRLHDICSIYRPFLLYVWDESEYISLLVKNKGAEVLFGNITAERVYSSYIEENNSQEKKSNFHRIWLVLLGVLLQQGRRNSRLRFQVNVNTELSMERGRFELLSATMPPTLTDFF